MALATLRSRAQNGLAADAVTVEVHLSGGLPGLSIVGLPEAAVREAKDRVRAAVLNCGFSYPARRITVNLAPADLPKEGGRFDLAIALGVLVAAGELPAEPLEQLEILGELSLSGAIRPVRGALPAALQAREAGRGLLLPADNVAEAGLARDTRLVPAHHFGALCAALINDALETHPPDTRARPRAAGPDLADVRGQAQARRALEIAAAGGHSLLMVGPPGSGKSMLASRLPGILPALDERESLDVAAIHSISHGGFDPQTWGQRPYRAPHHSASAAALVGGGSVPRPGEISLAHRGVLFLDELPEFSRPVLEVLREPLESGHITISRATRQTEFPASFQLVAAMNPCPCGHLGDDSRGCRCSPDQISRYRARLSGPLLDRIDLQVNVPRVGHAIRVEQSQPGESSAVVGERVRAARALAVEQRSAVNARLPVADLERHCRPDDAGARMLGLAMDNLGLSARAYHRILRLARTIADLDDSAPVESRHVAEAVQYRALDRRA